MRILLDCSFDGITNDIDWEHIDVILVSSYYDAIALPFITEYSKFNGRIFATLPTIEFARLAMKEKIDYITQLNSNNDVKHDFPFVYSDIEACIEKIEVIYFNDLKVLYLIFDFK